MKNMNKKTMALALVIALVFALAGCAATSLNLDELYNDVMALRASVDAYAASKGVEADDSYIEAEEEAEPDALTEYELLPFARFSNLYVTEGSEIVDYLAYVTVIDEEVVTAIVADASAVDLSTAGDYEVVYTVTVNKDMYDAYIAAQEYLTVTEADEGVDNVEHLGLVNGDDYTIAVKYLVGTEDEDAIPSLLRDEDGNIIKVETTFIVEGDSGELQIEHDLSLYPEDKAVTSVYFLLSGVEAATEDADTADEENAAGGAQEALEGTFSTEEVIVTKIVHVYSAEEYTAEVESGNITESEDGVATSTETEVVTPAPTATAKPSTTATPSATEKPTSTTTPTATATPKPSTNGTTTSATATPAPTTKPSTSTTTATATPKPTATAKPSTSGTTTTATATPSPTATAKPSTTTATATPIPTTSHTHSYTSTVTTAATCTTAGVRTYTCSCGDSYTESIAATGHSWVTETVVDQAAWTETIAGYYQCRACGATFSSAQDFSDHNGYVHDYSAAETYIYPETIYHEAETHSVTKCSICGAIQ